METTLPAPLAIIGMACRLPGANNLDEYWRLLIEGRSAIARLPADRLDAELYYHPEKGARGKTFSRIAGLIDYSSLAPEACGLSPQAAARYDLGHVAFCAVAAEACRHAGLDPLDLPLRNTGVFVGHSRGTRRGGDLVYSRYVEDTAQFLRDVPGFAALAGRDAEAIIEETIIEARRSAVDEPSCPADLAPHLAAGLVSKTFGLTGPAMVLNAACASSLQALALASRALRQDRVEMAIVGGASYCKSDTLILFSQAQSVSATGSRPFDAEADGLVVGEGYAAILVKTLARALADGDRILAVVRRIGVSSDGRGKSVWAPRKKGQVEAIRRGYGSDEELGRLQYIEAHATSTPLGDATEMAALAEALGNRLPPGTRIPVGSVKANIGHTLEAAGLAGLIKTVLAMQHAIIPRQINCHAPNPRIPWQTLPFFVPTDNRPWPVGKDGLPRTAAVNSFGIGGMNVHVVLEEGKPSPFLPGGLSPFSPEKSTEAADGPTAKMGTVPFDAAGGLSPFSPERSTEAADGPTAKMGTVPLARSAIAIIGAAGILPRPGSSLVTDYQYDWRRHKVPPLQVARANLLQFMLLDAVDAALCDAGYDAKPFDRQRTGVIVGAGLAGDFSDQLQMAIRLPDFQRVLAAVLRRRGAAEDRIAEISAAYGEILGKRLPVLLDETGSFTTSTLATRITKIFDLMGDSTVVDCGDATSLAAVSAAADLLRDGTCDLVICAAGQRRLGLPDVSVPDTLPTEGTVVLLLKRLADARRDGDPIRGVLRGIGAAHAPSPAAAAALADRRALPSTDATGAVECREITSGHAGVVSGVASLLAAMREWKDDRLRSAGVTSSDISGAAYHVRIERDATAPSAADGPQAAFLFADCDPKRAERVQQTLRDCLPGNSAAEQLDGTLHRLQLPGLAELARAPQTDAGNHLGRSRLALLAAETLQAMMLRSKGIGPDCVLGRGFGRYAALVAAGSCTFESAARAVTATDPAEGLRRMEIEPPRVPYLCSVAGRYLAEPDDLRAGLAGQASEATYAGLLSRLADEGTGAFWEIGPSDAPALRNTKLLGGRSVTIRSAGDAARNHSPLPRAGEGQGVRAESDGDSRLLATNSSLPSPRPSPGGRGGLGGESVNDAPSPQPSPGGRGGSVCQRFVMRMQEAPLPGVAAQPPRWNGTALLVGCNAVSRALRACIERQGGTAVELPGSDDIEECLAAVERLWQASPMPHLFLLAAHDDDATTNLDEDHWNRRRQRGVMLPYLVAQRWFQLVASAKLLDRASVVAATRLGGDFGFSGTAGGAEGGAMAGLVKGVRLEVLGRGQAKFRARVVDMAADLSPERAAAAILDESAVEDAEVEVAYAGGKRWVVRPLEQSAVTNGRPPSGTWIVTGGARGVTAVVARELGRRFGLKLHLIGSSPPPRIDPSWRDLSPEALRQLRGEVTRQAVAEGKVPIETWKKIEKALEMDRNLRMLKEAGVTATYHACDVSDRAALARLLDEIRAADGPIAGIVHGAGVESSCRFEKKRREMVSQTIAAKVDGAAALMHLTRSDPLRYFLAFGSISGRFGGHGQTDYCLANEMLSKLVAWQRQARPDCRSVTFQWHSWAEVGMAVRPESSHIKHLAQMEFMPTLEGADHLIAELLAGVPEPEVVITERQYCQRFHRQRPRWPLVDGAPETGPPHRLTAEVRLDPAADPFLREHRYKDQPILPAVMGVEAFAEAAALLAGGRQFVQGLRDFQIHRALQLFTERPAIARVVAQASPEGIVCRLSSDFHDRQGRLVQRDRLHFSAVVEMADQPPQNQAVAQLDGSRWRANLPTEAWSAILYADGLEPADCDSPWAGDRRGVIDVRRREEIICHGPPLRCLRQVQYAGDIGWGRIIVPPWQALAGSRPGEGWLAAPELLDAALHLCGIFLWVHGDKTLCLPQAIDRLRLGRKPRVGEHCTVQMQRRDEAVFDLVLLGEDGAVIFEIEGYRGQVVGRRRTVGGLSP